LKTLSVPGDGGVWRKTPRGRGCEHFSRKLALANALPLNGQTTGEISDRFQVYFVPAGYVFAIWFVIYLGLIAFAVYQALITTTISCVIPS